jgi:hypothetical protein
VAKSGKNQGKQRAKVIKSQGKHDRKRKKIGSGILFVYRIRYSEIIFCQKMAGF